MGCAIQLLEEDRLRKQEEPQPIYVVPEKEEFNEVKTIRSFRLQLQFKLNHQQLIIGSFNYHRF